MEGKDTSLAVPGDVVIEPASSTSEPTAALERSIDASPPLDPGSFDHRPSHQEQKVDQANPRDKDRAVDAISVMRHLPGCSQDHGQSYCDGGWNGATSKHSSHWKYEGQADQRFNDVTLRKETGR
jgi:hypothetical protein